MEKMRAVMIAVGVIVLGASSVQADGDPDKGKRSLPAAVPVTQRPSKTRSARVF
jgi:hypothetical protein